MNEFDDLEIELSGAPADNSDKSPLEKPEPATPEHINVDMEEDRYSRFRLIPWWRQDILKNSKVLVIGAGALGNEIVKNLALLGIGYIFIVDMDTIENSNLSRSILFRAADEGKYKADVIANSAMDINPDVIAQPFVGDIIHDLGLGVFRAFDIVMGGLDNREARLHINRCCWKVNRPFIDGAIEVLHGEARVFMPPHSACYECTMNEMDHKLLSIRRSCSLATRSRLLDGHIPTTPTTSSVIAGIQCQEMLKILHNNPKDLPFLSGQGFFFNGLIHDSFIKIYQRKEDCMSHVTYENIEPMHWKASDTRIGDVIDHVRSQLGAGSSVEIEHEIAYSLTCKNCDQTEPLFVPVGKITEQDEICPVCNETRVINMMHSLQDDETYRDKTLADIGIPPLDIITGRSAPEIDPDTGDYIFKTIHLELTGDFDSILGWLK